MNEVEVSINLSLNCPLMTKTRVHFLSSYPFLPQHVQNVEILPKSLVWSQVCWHSQHWVSQMAVHLSE